MLALTVMNSIWAAPIYLILAGLSSAIASTLATALWVGLYGPALLARVRSAVEALLVVASGASPIVMGFLIDWGVPLRDQAADRNGAEIALGPVVVMARKLGFGGQPCAIRPRACTSGARR